MAGAPGGVVGATRLAPYLFLAPVFVFGAIFVVLPVIAFTTLSFYSWDGFSRARYVGWGNYLYLATRDPLFARTLLNTFLFAGGTVLVAVPLGFLAAWLAWRSRGAALVRGVFSLPMITNVVAVGFLGRYLFDGAYGLVNKALGAFGIAGPVWLSDPSWAMVAVVLTSAWIVVGHTMLLFSAGLANLDEALFDAARLDGAGAWARFRHITVPLLQPVTLFAVLSTFVNAIGGFALILVMTEGGPFQSTNVTAFYMYQAGFQDLRLGRASAMAVVLFILVLVVALVQMRLMRRGGVEGW